CLDSVNYVTRYEDLVECFRRVHLFLEPGGVFLFDINTEYKLRSISGQAFISEAEGAYCAWRASFSEKRSICRYDFDLFVQEEDHWNRFFETHFERAYKVDELKSALREAGFSKEPVLYGELRLKPPEINAGRIFFAAQKEKK
ncbi:MAG: class I SAM-dependent methyltransferase, partial [Clostridiales bacterium]|nr:class I SAM-dependent methyltransferase [Clostridiales bacterium]